MSMIRSLSLILVLLKNGNMVRSFFTTHALLVRRGSVLVETFRRCSNHPKLDDMSPLASANNGQPETIDSKDDKIHGSCDDGWMDVKDWDKYASSPPPSSKFKTYSDIRGRSVHVQHDDSMRLPGSNISGNKARKMYALSVMPQSEFPDCVVSYGGAQSNAMLALAAICNYQSRREEATTRPEEVRNGNVDFDDLMDDENDKDDTYDQETDQDMPEPRDVALSKRFVYYTKDLPRFLRYQPSGNLFRAQMLGMELVEISKEEYERLFGGESGGSATPPPQLDPPIPGKSLWIPQGGACGMATIGARFQAAEIREYWRQHGNGRPLSVCVPSGTGTTAVLLHHALQDIGIDDGCDIHVVSIPCVGSAGYARRQMAALSVAVGRSEEDIPTVMLPSPPSSKGGPSRYLPFGAPDKMILDTYQWLRTEHDLNVDLLYGAPAWTVMMRYWGQGDGSENFPPNHFDPFCPLDGREILYIHSGGLEGISSQMLRYLHKNLVSVTDTQLPGRKNKRRHRQA